MHRLGASFAELLKTCDDEPVDLVALGLPPITRLAPAVRTAEPLRHDALSADVPHPLEQLSPVADDVLDIDNARSSIRPAPRAIAPCAPRSGSGVDRARQCGAGRMRNRRAGPVAGRQSRH